MIHTDEDDEFERIERENSMKGQPYHWEADAIKAAVLIEREACARIAEKQADVYATLEQNPITQSAWAACIDNRDAIRARGNT
jgi:hypothetical protein